jgi:hypothetical protein
MIHSVLPETHRSGSPASSACLPVLFRPVLFRRCSPRLTARRLRLGRRERAALGGSRCSTFCSPRKVGISPEIREYRRITFAGVHANSPCRFKAALLSAGKGTPVIMQLSSASPGDRSPDQSARGLIARFIGRLFDRHDCNPPFPSSECIADTPPALAWRCKRSVHTRNAQPESAKLNRDRENRGRIRLTHQLSVRWPCTRTDRTEKIRL